MSSDERQFADRRKCKWLRRVTSQSATILRNEGALTSRILGGWRARAVRFAFRNFGAVAERSDAAVVRDSAGLLNHTHAMVTSFALDLPDQRIRSDAARRNHRSRSYLPSAVDFNIFLTGAGDLRFDQNSYAALFAFLLRECGELRT